MKVIFPNFVCASCHSVMVTWDSDGKYTYCPNKACPEHGVKYKYPTMELEKYET